MFNKKLIPAKALDFTTSRLAIGDTLGRAAITDNFRLIAIARIIGNTANDFIRYIKGWERRAKLRRELINMPDYLLSDIGLQRNQINGIVSGRIENDSRRLGPISDRSSRKLYKDQTETSIAA
jgi:uncharacterized protein YjiS (DUF1127 family)